MSTVPGFRIWAQCRMPISICIFLFIFVHTSDSQKILSVSTHPSLNKDSAGSMAGGTWLYIKGYGFSEDHYSGSNKVFIGPKSCPTISYMSTPYLIVCVTEPGFDMQDATPLPLRVLVDEKRYADCNWCTFTYRWDRTSYLKEIRPPSGAPGDIVTLHGDFRTYDPADLREVRIGNYLCGLGSSDDNLNVDSTVHQQIRCIVGNQPAGYYNSSISIMNSFGRSTFSNKSTIGLDPFRVAPDNSTFMFQVHPVIDALSHSQGSLSGGLLLTITGRGFSPIPTENSVDINGVVPCQILSASDRQLICETTPSGDQLGNATMKFRGNRGLVRNFYKDQSFTLSLSRIQPTAINRVDAFQSPLVNSDQTSYTESFYGLFKPPVSGMYQFFVASDDRTVLYLSNSSDPTNKVQILNFNSWIPLKAFFSTPSQTSAPVNLTAGELYYIEAIHNQAFGGDNMDIAVRVPWPSYRYDSIREQQTISIETTIVREQQTIVFNGATGQFKFSYTYLDPTTGATTTKSSNTISVSDSAGTIQNEAYSTGINSAVAATRSVTGNTTTFVLTLNSPLPSETYQRNLLQIVSVSLICPPQNPWPCWSVTRTRSPSPPIRGSFTLTFPGLNSTSTLSTTTQPISWDSSASFLQNEISKVLNCVVSVQKVGTRDAADGAQFLVVFDGKIGDVPLLTANSANLRGGNGRPFVQINETLASSTDLFLSPIPSDYLFTLESKPQVHVRTNSIPSSCNTDCSFIALQSFTPIITTLSNSVNGDGVLVFSGTGSGFLPFNMSRFGPSPDLNELSSAKFGNGAICNITQLSDTSFTCIMSQGGALAGPSRFDFRVKDKGRAMPVDPQILEYEFPLTISGVSPASGSINGGLSLTLTGSNFGFDPHLISVQTDSNTTCQVVTVSPTQIVCVTAEHSAGSVQGLLIVNGVNTTFQFEYSDASTPLVTSISPTEATVTERTFITIMGIRFSSVLSENIVTIGSSSSECVVVQATNSVITCYLDGGSPSNDNNTVRVLVNGKGYATSNATFTNVLTLDSVSPSQGSTEGSTHLTLTGRGFMPLNSTAISNPTPPSVMISAGPTLQFPCAVKNISFSQIVCLTAESGMLPTEEPLTVYVKIKNYQATCPNCTYQFSTSGISTPRLSSVQPSGNISIGQNSITISGNGFSNIPGENVIGISDKSPTLNSASDFFDLDLTACQIQSISTNQIVCNMSPRVFGAKYLFVWVKNAGIAQGSLALNFVLNISGISPNFASLGSTRLTISGHGFSPVPSQNKVLFNNYDTCTIISASPSSLICLTPRSRWSWSASRTSISVSLPTSSTPTTQSTPWCSTPSCQLVMNSTFSPIIKSAIFNPNSQVLQISGSGFGLSVEVSIGGYQGVSNNPQVFLGGVNATVGFANSTNIVATLNGPIPGGVYPVTVYIQGKGYAMPAFSGNSFAPTVNISTPLGLTSFTPLGGSWAGGQVVTLTGMGFDSQNVSNNMVRFCNAPCIPITATPSTLTCKTTPLFTPHSLSTHNLAPLSGELNGSLFSSGPAGSLSLFNAFDKNPNTVFATSNSAGFIGMDFGPFTAAILTRVSVFPRLDIWQGPNYAQGAVIEGSNDNANYDILFTISNVPKQSWNYFDIPANTSGYRYIRYRARSNTWTNIADLIFTGHTIFNISQNSPTDPSTPCDATMQVGPNFVTPYGGSVNQFVYGDGDTPILSGISPETGSTLGGTIVTLQGSGFGQNSSLITVYIDTTPCTPILSSTPTNLTCRTGARPDFVADPQNVVVNVEGKGQTSVIGEVKFMYVDRWSDVRTWGGEAPPREGETVYIPQGQHILLDVSPPRLNLILIEGSLTFSDETDLSLDAYYIFVNGGRLTIGTEDKPHLHKATITLWGDRDTPQLPVYGSKFIAVRHGVLDIHGKPVNPTWTRLAKTILPSNDTLTLTDPVEWSVGDRIVVAPSNYSMHEAEEVQIVTKSADNRTLTVDPPFQFEHYGKIDIIGGVEFDFRSEVGLLTRNIVLRGDASTERTQFGAMIMIHSPGNETSIGRIENLECTLVGQAFQLGRYPLHFHMIGTVSQSYVRNNTIHKSFNRAITLHGVHHFRVQNNVAYDIMGHTFFIEDGIETKNLLENNLGLLTKASYSLLDTDTTPATFWVTNPDNTWRNNAAAGSERYGYWFSMPEHPGGPSFTTEVCPRHMRLGDFSDNRAHSNGRYGLRIYRTYIPRDQPCVNVPIEKDLIALDFSSLDYAINPPATSTFHRLTSYKNGRNGAVAGIIGDLRFVDFRLADSRRAGFEVEIVAAPKFTTQLDGAVIVGHSPNQKEPIEPVVVDEEFGAFGVVTPRSENFTVWNTKFINYDQPMVSAFGSCSRAIFIPIRDQDARVTHFANISYENAPNRVQWGYPFKALFYDSDGSLSRTNNFSIAIGGSAWVTPLWNHTLGVRGCQPDPIWNRTLLCSTEFTNLRRVAINGGQPADILRKKNMLIRREGFANASSLPFELRTDPGEGWAIGFATGETYNVWFQGFVDWEKLVLSFKWLEPSDWFYLKFNYTDYRDHFRVTKTWDWKEIPVSSLALPSPSSALGTAFHNKTEQTLSVLISGNTALGSLSLTAHRCPRTGCPLPDIESEALEPFTRLWSNATQWPAQRLPSQNEDVTVPAKWRLIMDIQPPTIKNLMILGELSFSESLASTILEANNIVILGGSLLAGSSVSPFSKQITIRLIGNRQTPGVPINDDVDVGTKVLANFGKLKLFGQPYVSSWVRLGKSVSPGATAITLNQEVDWPIGSLIGITSSDFNYTQAEVRRLVGRSNKEWVIDSPIDDFHFGALDSEIVVETRAEVALLDRNIRITSDTPSENDQFGCHVSTGSFFDKSKNKIYFGQSVLSNILVGPFCGQEDTDHSPINFKHLDISKMNFPGLNREQIDAIRSNFSSDSFRSGVFNSVVWASYLPGVFLNEVNGMDLIGNVVFDTKQSSFRVTESHNVNIRGNLAAVARPIPDPAGQYPIDFAERLQALANFEICYPHSMECRNLTITENVAAGCGHMGFLLQPETCDKIDQDGSIPGSGRIFFDNLAHSSRVGVWARSAGYCTAVADVTVHKTWEFGVFYMRFGAIFKLKRAVLADNFVGVNLNPNYDGDWNRVEISDSTIIGTTSNPGCGYQQQDGPLTNEQCRARGCGPRIGIMASSFQTKMVPTFKFMPVLPAYLPWHLVKSDSAFGGFVQISNATFTNFTSSDGCGNKNAVISSNPLSPDFFPVHHFADSSLSNVAWDAIAHMDLPNPDWINGDDCVDMDCTGLLNAVIKDLDGSLLGTPGSILSYNPRIADPRLCTYRLGPKAYYCPGAFYDTLVFESIDNDALTRRVHPVTVSSLPNSDFPFEYTNVLNSMMDHGWDMGYTSLLRQSRFPVAVQTGRMYNVTFTGTNPRDMKFQMRGDLNQKGVILSIKYQSPEQLQLEVDGQTVAPSSVMPTLDSASGSNYYEFMKRRLTFVVKGPQIVKIHTLPSIQVTLRLNISVNDFYDKGGTGSFVYRIAFVLGISIDRIRIASIRSGSTILDFAILEKNATSTVPTNPTAPQVSPMQTNFTTTNEHASLSDLSNMLTQKLTSGGVDLLGAPIMEFSVSVSLPPPKPCLLGCPTNSVCNDGVCMCNSGYQGENCTAAISLCPPGMCGTGATCVSGTCVCPVGTSGDPHQSCSSLSAGAQAGIAVGVFLFVAFCASVYIYKKRRQAKNARPNSRDLLTRPPNLITLTPREPPTQNQQLASILTFSPSASQPPTTMVLLNQPASSPSPLLLQPTTGQPLPPLPIANHSLLLAPAPRPLPPKLTSISASSVLDTSASAPQNGASAKPWR